MADGLDDLKRKSVLAHRILTMTGSMGDTTGHVFVRVPGSNEMLARCRNEVDVSPAYVEPRSLHRVDFAGNPVEDLGDWTIPPERFIGTTLFKRRPEVGCVIHAHPPAQVLCSILDIPLQPLVGAQNWGGSAVALGGIPIYPRSLLIHNEEIGAGLMAVMGNKDVGILKAHGNVVTGRTIEEATIKAIRVENLAKLCWQFAVARRHSPDISWDDWADHFRPQAAQETGMQGGVNWSWDHYVKMLSYGAPVPRESTVDLEQY